MSATTVDPVNCFPVIETPLMFPGCPAVQTIWRWIREGVPGPNGERIKLSSFKVAGRRFVTRDAIDRFIRDSNATAGPVEKEVPRADA